MDAVVVGSGPNGLSAAITLARAGWSVRVIEAADTIGGGASSAALTLPGFLHDTCSAVYPLAVASPFLRALPLHEHGLEWAHPEVALGHPIAAERAGLLWRDLEATVQGLGPGGPAYRRLVGPLVEAWDDVAQALFDPFTLPRHPLHVLAAALQGALPARWVSDARLAGEEARALFAGAAAHAFQPLERPLTAAFGLLLLAAGHAVGWPVAVGGAQAISDALASHLRSMGGEIVTGHRVRSLAELPQARAVLLDLTPAEALRVAGDTLPAAARRRLERHRWGPAAFKLDYALDGPVPWTAAGLDRAGTVHLGGTAAEVAAAERDAAEGRVPRRPFVIVAQPSAVDPRRAPDGKQVLWAYCHVPNGCDRDMTEAVEAQLERFAPGFRDLVLARHTRGPAALEAANPNLVGGDISGGAQDPLQFLGRVARPRPYALGVPGVWLCSSSTPPGAGVHGLCGYHAARAALRSARGQRRRRAM